MTVEELQARLDDMAPLSEDGTTRYARVAGDYLAALAADAIQALGLDRETVARGIADWCKWRRKDECGGVCEHDRHLADLVLSAAESEPHG